MKIFLHIILLSTLIATIGDASAVDNQTMTGGFNFHGIIESGSMDKQLLVTGKFLFPIVNKYRKGNNITNEPAKILERVNWELNVENFPIKTNRIYCWLPNTDPLRFSEKYTDCLNRKISITIKQPNISFDESGLAIAIQSKEVSIMPFEIIMRQHKE